MDQNSSAEFKELKKLVDTYFVDNKLDPKGNFKIWRWTLLGSSLFICVLFFIYLVKLSLFQLVGIGIVLGLMAGWIGALGHEAVHYAFSRKTWVNNLMASAQDLLGLSSKYYQFKHLVHHHYTNQKGLDPDIDLEPFMRTSKNEPKNWYHAYQHIYAPFLYALTIPYLVVDPYTFKNQKIGAFNYSLGIYQRLKLVCIKLSPILLLFVLPSMTQGWLNGLWFYLVVQVMGGLYLSFVIQPGHLYEGTQFFKMDPSIKNARRNWLGQLTQTTCTFAPNSRLTNVLTVGLNNHLVHSLFPQISHAHFIELYPIIKKYCTDQGIEVKEFSSTFSVWKSHFRYLKSVGQS